MPAVKVNWHDGQTDAGVASSFAEQASQALIDWLTTDDSQETNNGNLYDNILGSSGIPLATGWIAQLPWAGPQQYAEGGNLPRAYVWTQHTGTEFRETATLNPTFRTTIRIIRNNADLTANRANAHRLAQWIGARLSQAIYSGSLIQGNMLWFNHYWNFTAPISYTVDDVTLTGDEPDSHIYALDLTFEWEHSDDRS